MLRAELRYFAQSNPTDWSFGLITAITRVFLRGSASSRGRTRITFQRTWGTVILRSLPMISFEPSLPVPPMPGGPQAMYYMCPSFTRRRQLSSRRSYAFWLLPADCGTILVVKETTWLSSGLAERSLAGHMCPRSKPLPW